ncbi:MAG: hypothetical protein AAFX99_30390, partial [Myxococcota bacterium]
MPFPHAYVTPLKPSPMLALLVLLLTACPLQAHEPHEASKPTASAKDSPTRTSYDPVRYEAQLTALEQRRLRLARRYARATTERDRAIVRQRARRVVTEAILDNHSLLVGARRGAVGTQAPGRAHPGGKDGVQDRLG